MFLLSLEKLVVHAISFRLSEAEPSMHLIPKIVFKGNEIQNHPKMI